jgi:hypothetical protein
MEPDSLAALERRQLDDHFQRYVDLSKLLITLSTASIAMLTALSGIVADTVSSGNAMRPSLTPLAISMLSGVLVQIRICMRPFGTIDVARTANAAHQQQTAQAAASGEQPPTAEIAIRQPPTKLERFAFGTQVGAFALAFGGPPIFRLLCP